MARVFLAAPTADGIAMAGFVVSLAATMTHLASAGIAAAYASVDGQDIGAQRGELVRRFLRSDATHFLSLDSDMTFSPDLAAKLLGFAKPIVGVVYPKRDLDLARMRRHADTRTFRDAFALSQDWNLRLAGSTLRMENELARVDAIPSGFKLVERGILERIAALSGVGGPFDEIEHEGEILEGDYAFCLKATRLGETIWAYPAADCGHLGDWRHAARLGDALRFGAFA